MSINKIHINNTTNLSLNDRFTVMQSVGPKLPTPTRKVAPRRRTQSASSILEKPSPNVSLANRKLLEQLDKKHKMRAALKLKRKSMKAILPNRPRLRNRIGLRKGAATAAIRLTPSGRLSRSNSLTNVATMKADLVQTTTLRRSNSTSSLAGRLGSRRASTGSAPTGPRRRIKRNNIVRASSRQNLVRSNSTASLKRSNSRLSLKRSNSRQSLKRSNSRSSLNRVSGGQGSPQRRIARNALRGASSQRRGGQRRSNSVSNRLGVRRAPMARDRIRADNIRGGRARRGRILNRRNSTTAVSNLSRNGGSRQGRPGRPRGRGTNMTQRGRSRSRSRSRNVRQPQSENRGNRSSSRGRGRGRGRGKGVRPGIKKEDLDKELDQYMATTRTGLDNEMDLL
ncbi:chromatin target of PRMT1 protein [Hermetia illucens]|nr:chromatin target of PRMT1 protein [Hermetia illucens]